MGTGVLDLADKAKPAATFSLALTSKPFGLCLPPRGGSSRPPRPPHSPPSGPPPSPPVSPRLPSGPRAPGIGTKALSVSMQHSQKGGVTGRGKKTKPTDGEEERNGILRGGLSRGDPVPRSAPLSVGKLVTGLGLGQGPWWQPPAVLRENLELGSDLEGSSHP